jgi:M6 family metalloprotease-like protein
MMQNARSLPWLILLCGVVSCTPQVVVGPGPNGDPGPPAPVDPQVVRDQDDMTWDDYRPIPGVNWADPSRRASKRTMRVAIVPADYSDYPFVITQPRGSDLFGNPRVEPVPRAMVPNYWADFYNKPQQSNHGHTLHEYWMEQSRGQIGVEVVGFGPYRMPKRYFQYGQLPPIDVPFDSTPDNTAARELDSLWRADIGDSLALTFDLVVRMYAGYDETAVWQEFGEMKFQTREDITREWGNPDTTKPRWVRSRYVPWTSWMAGVWPWSNANAGKITQGEGINSIRHEIAHAAFSIGDNYNNSYVTPYRRTPVGPWDLMDRGSFNGPGGPHTRFVVPPNLGGSMSSGLMLRQRLQFGFVDTSQVLMLSRDGLAKSGIAVATVIPRAVAPKGPTVAGISIRLDGAAPQDRTPVDDPARNPLSSGVPNFNFYTMEVVQRMGFDSFTPDEGVLIAKNKDRPSNAGGPNGVNVFSWTIDAHPEDINKVDFRRPNGETVMRSIADYRQLNDALFHAGERSGSKAEWQDTPNRLHFYVIHPTRHDATTLVDGGGLKGYIVAVRSLDGAGPHTRGVSLTALDSHQDGARKNVLFQLRNTGTTAPVPDNIHPRRRDSAFESDVYRLSATVDGTGWSVDIDNAFAVVEAGMSALASVQARHTTTASSTAKVTLRAVSESDPTKVATASMTVRR